MAPTTKPRNPLTDDLDRILKQTNGLWDELRNQRIFITGGTGFFGCWLLESLAWANAELNLNASATILTRNKANFAKKCPHLYTNSMFDFLEGDIRTFTYPDKKYSHMIHAATEACATLNTADPLLMLETIIDGTKHTLEFAKLCGVKKFLFTSSGAVYGKQPDNVTSLSEDHPCQPNPLSDRSAYALGKSVTEFMSCQYGKKFNFEVKIARCFAFIGPHLPIDGTYAIGNFIRDALNGKPITIKGDGTPYRSYLYAADLAAWLWKILFIGEPETAYNVGSDQDYSILQIANIVAKCFTPIPQVKCLQTPSANSLPERYVPDISHIKNDLQLTPQVNLEHAIQLTKQWHLSNQTNKVNSVA